MDLTLLSNGLYLFNGRSGNKEEIKKYMCSSFSFCSDEIDYAMEQMDLNMDNIAHFGVINRMFIFTRDSREQQAS